jgi:hypothetical protein
MATTKKTPLQRLKAKKRDHCNGKATKEEVKQAAKKYLDNVKVKDHDTAKQKVKEILESGCAVSGTKPKVKRKATAKKKTGVGKYVMTRRNGRHTTVLYENN